jgi:hypothetical protein
LLSVLGVLRISTLKGFAQKGVKNPDLWPSNILIDLLVKGSLP